MSFPTIGAGIETIRAAILAIGPQVHEVLPALRSVRRGLGACFRARVARERVDLRLVLVDVARIGVDTTYVGPAILPDPARR